MSLACRLVSGCIVHVESTCSVRARGVPSAVTWRASSPVEPPPWFPVQVASTLSGAGDSRSYFSTPSSSTIGPLLALESLGKGSSPRLPISQTAARPAFPEP